MAKKENLKTFVIQQTDIDKAINYHLDKGENGEFKTYYTDGMKRYMPDAK